MESEPTTIRRLIRSNTTLVSILAVFVICAAILFSIKTVRHPQRTYGHAYFVDQDTLTPKELKFDSISPVTDSDGHVWVKAVYKSCNACQTRTLVYLEKYTPETKAALEETQKTGVNAHEILNNAHKGLWVRDPDPKSPWVQADSPEGKKIENSYSAPGQAIYNCDPVD